MTAEAPHMSRLPRGRRPVLNWDEMDSEAKKSVTMQVGRKPNKFPAVLDVTKRIVVDGVSGNPDIEIAAHEQKKAERKKEKNRRSLDAVLKRISALENEIEKLKVKK